jgi:uridine kinase
MSYVIAVAAPPGGGKTALVRALSAKLGDATTIHFDAYEMATSRPVIDILRDIRDGGGYDDFASPQLAVDLAALKNGEAIMTPDEGRVEPAKYILFEMPMGREHGPTAQLIDLVLWIDVPLDLALARKLREYVTLASDDTGPARAGDFVVWLGGYLENYLSGIRDTLEIQRDRVGGGADMTLDGCLNPERMAEQAAAEILAWLP